MIVTLKKIISLPVRTVLGAALGRIANAQIDAEKHVVLSYLVVSGWLDKKTFLIKPVQVVSLNEKEMVVEDSLLKEDAVKKDEKISLPLLENNAAMREEN